MYLDIFCDFLLSWYFYFHMVSTIYRIIITQAYVNATDNFVIAIKNEKKKAKKGKEILLPSSTGGKKNLNGGLPSE